MAFSLETALGKLAELTANGRVATLDELLDIAKNVSVYTEGNVTVLYSGGVLPDGQSYDSIINEITSRSDVRILDQTDASNFLKSTSFRAAVAANFGLTVDDLEVRNEATEWLFHEKMVRGQRYQEILLLKPLERLERLFRSRGQIEYLQKQNCQSC